MLDQLDVLRIVIETLDSANIPYMLVGSYASSMYGRGRATHDIDLVISTPSDRILEVRNTLGEDFYLDEISAVEAIENNDMFNALHIPSGTKVDFWVIKEDEFSLEQFSRRRLEIVDGFQAYIASPEDTILSKLLWYQISPSERQLTDAQGIIEVQEDLDWDYLNSWAEKLDVVDLLEIISQPGE